MKFRWFLWCNTLKINVIFNLATLRQTYNGPGQDVSDFTLRCSQDCPYAASCPDAVRHFIERF